MEIKCLRTVVLILSFTGMVSGYILFDRFTYDRHASREKVASQSVKKEINTDSGKMESSLCKAVKSQPSFQSVFLYLTWLLSDWHGRLRVVSHQRDESSSYLAKPTYKNSLLHRKIADKEQYKARLKKRETCTQTGGIEAECNLINPQTQPEVTNTPHKDTALIGNPDGPFDFDGPGDFGRPEHSGPLPTSGDTNSTQLTTSIPMTSFAQDATATPSITTTSTDDLLTSTGWNSKSDANPTSTGSKLLTTVTAISSLHTLSTIASTSTHTDVFLTGTVVSNNSDTNSMMSTPTGSDLSTDATATSSLATAFTTASTTSTDVPLTGIAVTTNSDTNPTMSTSTGSKLSAAETTVSSLDTAFTTASTTTCTDALLTGTLVTTNMDTNPIKFSSPKPKFSTAVTSISLLATVFTTAPTSTATDVPLTGTVFTTNRIINPVVSTSTGTKLLHSSTEIPLFASSSTITTAVPAVNMHISLDDEGFFSKPAGIAVIVVLAEVASVVTGGLLIFGLLSTTLCNPRRRKVGAEKLDVNSQALSTTSTTTSTLTKVSIK